MQFVFYLLSHNQQLRTQARKRYEESLQDFSLSDAMRDRRFDGPALPQWLNEPVRYAITLLCTVLFAKHVFDDGCLLVQSVCHQQA